MGNMTNDENWAARERLRMIEVLLWWRGWIRRTDLIDYFGISPAQASSDLQRFMELNSTGVTYHTVRKRYEAGETFACVVHEPQWEEALSLLPGAVPERRITSVTTETSAEAVVDSVQPLRRTIKENVLRRIYLALRGKQAVEVRYLSVNSSSRRWRKIVPGGFGWDGNRWHVRAWDAEAELWKDFVLGRMEDCRWPIALKEELPRDIDWETFVTLKIKPNRKLDKAAQDAIRLDYGMGNQGLTLRVRKAMELYWRRRLDLTDDSQVIDRLECDS
jgi:predicted DNA-binding transcriptional regulator YafY